MDENFEKAKGDKDGKMLSPDGEGGDAGTNQTNRGDSGNLSTRAEGCQYEEVSAPIKRGLRRTAEEWEAKQAARRNRKATVPGVTEDTAPHSADAEEGINENAQMDGSPSASYQKKFQHEDENTQTETGLDDQQDIIESQSSHPQALPSPNFSEEDLGPRLQGGLDSITVEEELVEANLLGSSHFISLDDMEVAEPMDPFRTDEQTQRAIQERKKTKSMLFCMLAAAGFVLLIVIGLVVYFAIKSSNSKDEFNTGSPNANVSSAAPTEEPLLALLPASTQKVIQGNTQSPQSKAYQWLLDDPQFWDYSDARLVQRFAMATLFYSTNGPNWKHKGGETVEVMLVHGGSSVEPPPGTGGPNLPTGRPPGVVGGGGPPGGGRPPSQGSRPPGGGSGPPGGGTVGSFLGTQRPIIANVTRAEWLDHTAHECDWFSRSFNTMCPEDNQTIVFFIMVDNWLAGSLPPELGLLSALQDLLIFSNDVGGRLVTEIGALTNLQRLELAVNKFTGTFPSEIGQLSNLTKFQIDDNGFSGTIPTQFWWLSHLSILAMGRNMLSGTLPSNLSGLVPDLREFHFHGNQFSGSLPTSIGHCTHLRHLNAWSNQFTGQIPPELGLLTALVNLELGSNEMSGTIPSEFGQLSRLKTLLLGGNDELSGSFPLELGLLSGKLLELDIQGTAIAGAIPSSLCYMDTNSSSSEVQTQLLFDCSSTLCGCSCPCFNFNNST